MKRAAILLAAGSSRRFGVRNKLLHELNGQTLLEIAIDTLHSSGAFNEIFVVCGFEAWRTEEIVIRKKATVVNAFDWDRGISASIRAGVLTAAEYDVVLIALADMPFITAATIVKVANAVNEGQTIACSVNENYQGIPAAFLLKAHHTELLALSGDQGAKKILQLHTDKVLIHADASELTDIDCP